MTGWHTSYQFGPGATGAGEGTGPDPGDVRGPACSGGRPSRRFGQPCLMLQRLPSCPRSPQTHGGTSSTLTKTGRISG